MVRTRSDETRRTTSSISAPWLQARMLHQARIEQGMRVLEVGSGCCQPSCSTAL
ncbi:hypothetical protein [Kribbella capetownensis]|uniref:hypothetical protein n=1 Tax=Kribbella capetownensis TaxID=1572659 RepID=UPI002353E7B9|nr:hypothetical protein [Kribbella capetownensis]